MAEHNTLTGAQLHEPKGVENAIAGQVYVADGAASGAWTSLASNKATKQLTGSGSYTVPAGVTSIEVTCFGPGYNDGQNQLATTFDTMTAGSAWKITSGSKHLMAAGAGTGGDVNITGSGSSPTFFEIISLRRNRSGDFYDAPPASGGLTIKTYSVTPGQSFSYSISPNGNGTIIVRES